MCTLFTQQLAEKEREIERLHNLLQNRQTTQTSRQPNDHVILGGKLFEKIRSNIEALDSQYIYEHLTCSAPAYKSLLELLCKVFQYPNQEGYLCTVVNSSFILYINENNQQAKENYVFLFDRIFALIYNKCKQECQHIHEDINTEDQCTISDNFHDNMMILNSDTPNKKKLQKDLLNVIKHNAFTNT